MVFFYFFCSIAFQTLLAQAIINSAFALQCLRDDSSLIITSKKYSIIKHNLPYLATTIFLGITPFAVVITAV